MPLTIEAVGYAAAALTTAAFAPQVWRTWRTRSARDLSLAMLAMQCTGNAFWTLYGAGVGAWPLVAANVLTMALVLALLAMKLGLGGVAAPALVPDPLGSNPLSYASGGPTNSSP